ncbi:MAG: DUF3311 domain-containing protein [Acidobacteria bacterium]|nr:MAG: DUF3311 domain-containing protein [Acidobacteriota bacterium]
MQKAAAASAVVLLYLLHQDFWFWREARPLVFGFLPIGLFYHAAFTVASAGVLWLLVTLAWPLHLEETHRPHAPRAARGGDDPQASGAERGWGPRE